MAMLACARLSGQAAETNAPEPRPVVKALLTAQGAFAAARHETPTLTPALRTGFKAQDAKAQELAAAFPAAILAALSANAEQRVAWALTCAFRTESATLVSGTPTPLPDLAPILPQDFTACMGESFALDTMPLITDQPEAWAAPAFWGKPPQPPAFSGWMLETNIISFTNTATPLIRSDIFLDDAEVSGELCAWDGDALLLILRSGIVVKFQPGPVSASAGNVNVKFGYDNLSASSLYGKAGAIEPGQWYGFNASISGQCLRVTLEGQEAINTRIAADPRLAGSRLAGAGSFGLGGHKSSGQFRNIRIKALSPQGRMRLPGLAPQQCYTPDGPALDFLTGNTNDFVSLAHQSVEPYKPASHVIENGMLTIKGAPYAQFARRNLVADHYRVSGRVRLLEEGGIWFRVNHRLLFGLLSAQQGPPFAVKLSTGGFQRWDQESPGEPVPIGDWLDWELEYHAPYGVFRVNKRPVMLATGAFARSGNERMVSQFGISAYNTAAELTNIMFQRLAPGGMAGKPKADRVEAWYKMGFSALAQARAGMTNSPALPRDTLALNILEGRQSPICASLDDFRAVARTLKEQKDFPGLIAFLEAASSAMPTNSQMRAELEKDHKSAKSTYETAMKNIGIGEPGPDRILRTGDNPADLLPAHDGVHVWLSLHQPNRVLRLNPATATITHSTNLQDEILMPVARRDYWIGISADNHRTLLKVNPMSGATIFSNTFEKGTITSLAQHPFQTITYVAVDENPRPDIIGFDHCHIYLLNESNMTFSATKGIGTFLSADPAGRYLYAGFSVALSPRLTMDPSFLRVDANRGFIDHLLRYRITPESLQLDAQISAPGTGGFDVESDPSGSIVFYLSVLGYHNAKGELQQAGAVAGFRAMRWNKPAVKLESGGTTTAIEFSADSRRAFLAAGPQIRTHSMETGELITSSHVPATLQAIRQLLVAPDGATLLAAFAGKPSGVYLHRISNPAGVTNTPPLRPLTTNSTPVNIADESPWTAQGNQAAQNILAPLLTTLSKPELMDWTAPAIPIADSVAPTPDTGGALPAANRWRLPAGDPTWETTVGFQDALDDLGSFQGLADTHPWSWLWLWVKTNRTYPESARLQLELARRLEQMGLFDNALSAGQITVELCGNEGLIAFRAWLLLGRLYGKKGDAPRQINAFQEALQLCPGDAYAHLKLGQSLVAAGFSNQGVRHLQIARKIFPSRRGLDEELARLGHPPPPGQTTLDTSTMFRRIAPAVAVISREDGNGTGFLVSRNGILLTNHHVVDGAEDLTVQFRDPESGSELSVTGMVVACDSIHDIALLSVSATPPNLAPLDLADSDTVRTGDPVVVIGNPGFGVKVLSQTTTEGIVSGKNRMLGARGFFQISAAVNPGNSGGPMLLRNGRVAGMVTLKAQLENVGFAVPANDLLAFIENLEEE